MQLEKSRTFASKGYSLDVVLVIDRNELFESGFWYENYPEIFCDAQLALKPGYAMHEIHMNSKIVITRCN